MRTMSQTIYNYVLRLR